MFVQTISFSTGRIDEIQKMAQEYEAQQEGQARGYIRSVTLKDRDRENAYMVHVEFESYELAMQKSAGQNSRRSEFTTVQESGPHVWQSLGPVVCRDVRVFGVVPATLREDEVSGMSVSPIPRPPGRKRPQPAGSRPRARGGS
jgi:hypothetical protein